MAVEHAQFFVRHGFLNPHHAVAGLLHFFDKVLALVGKFDRIGSTRTEHHLGALVNLRDGLDKLADTLLARNAAHEQHVWALRIHTPLGKDILVECRRVKFRIDTVVDNLHAVFGNAVELHHVALHALAHRNHAVGSLVGSAFNPAAHRVAAVTELFRLPRAVRFQRVRREDQRALQKAARQHATKMAVPGVAMDDVDILERGRPLEVDIERLENFLEAVVRRIEAKLARKTESADIVLVDILAPEAAGFDMAKLCKFLRQELHMDTGTAVNFRRKFVSKDCSVHKSTSALKTFSRN